MRPRVPRHSPPSALPTSAYLSTVAAGGSNPSRLEFLFPIPPPLTSRVKGRRTRAGLAVRGKERRLLRGKENDLEGEPPRVLLYFLSILYFLVASASFALHDVEPLFVDVFTVEAPSAVGEPPNLHLSCGARSSSRGRASSLGRSLSCPCKPSCRRAYAGDAGHRARLRTLSCRCRYLHRRARHSCRFLLASSRSS
jgi:hypothetical protein